MVRWVWPWTHTNSDLFDLQCFSRQICTFLPHFVLFQACTVPFAIYPMTFFIASSCCPSLDDSRAFLRSSNFFDPAKSAESSAVPELLSSLITRLWRISLQKGRFFSLKKKSVGGEATLLLSHSPNHFLSEGRFSIHPPTRCRQKVPLWLNN